MEKQITIEDVYNTLMQLNENLIGKIDGVQQNINTKINELETKIDSKYIEVEERINKIEVENSILREKLRTAEFKLRKKNLIFHGIEEQRRETDTIILDKIKGVITDILGVTDFKTEQIANAFRIGKNSPRPILVELTSSILKKTIIAKRILLKGRRIFINEDLSPEEREEKKYLLKYCKQIKASNKECYMRGKCLIIEGKSFSYTDIKDQKHVKYISNIPSNYSPSITCPTTSALTVTSVEEEEEEILSEESVTVVKDQKKGSQAVKQKDKPKKKKKKI